MKVATAEQMQELDRKTIETYRNSRNRPDGERRPSATEAISTFSRIFKRGKSPSLPGRETMEETDLSLPLPPEPAGCCEGLSSRGPPRSSRRRGGEFSNFKRMKGEVLSIPSSMEFQKVRKDLEKFDLVIDAIFGTGLDAEVRGYYRESSPI